MLRQAHSVSPPVTRVLLCDDHEIVREALGRVIETVADMQVVASAASCAEVEDLAGRVVPDVAVVDMRLGDGTGLDAMALIHRWHPRCRVIFLTSFQSDRAMLSAYEQGARAFLLKSTPVRELLETIRTVAAGVKEFDVGAVRSAAERIAGSGHTEFMETDDIGRKILVLLAGGLSDQEIGDAVGLNVQTVRNRVSRLLQSFGKHNRTQLALLIDRLMRHDESCESAAATFAATFTNNVGDTVDEQPDTSPEVTAAGGGVLPGAR